MSDDELISPIVYKIVSENVIDGENFTCELRANINDQETFYSWLKQFSSDSKTNWILRSSVSAEKSKFAFSRDYVCQHSSFHKSSKKDIAVQKNKDCMATLKVRIKHNTRNTRCRDKYVKEGLCAVININFQHSHRLNVAEAWGWLKRKDETRQTFLQYFNSGMSPAEARHYHEDVLLAEGAEVLADASVNPPNSWIYYLHDIWRLNEYGGAKKDESFFNAAEKRISDLKGAGFKTVITEKPFKIIVISPIMQRTLKSLVDPSCIFIDSSASMDQTSSTVTVISTATKAGAIPVAVCLHSNQTEEIYKYVFLSVFELWGEINPRFRIEMFMTDDSDALRNALHNVWPNVRMLLCQFHVLQAVWRWLWNSANNVQLSDRKIIINMIKKVMYSKTQYELKVAKDEILNKFVVPYPNVVCYFNQLCRKEDDWSFCGRKNVQNRSNNTNNYAEATFRILKDIILIRLKAYNALALLDFLSYVLEKYYKVRLLDFAYGRVKKPYLIFQKIIDKSSFITKDMIADTEDGLYTVLSKDCNTVYTVNRIVGFCSCYSGCQGGFCYHQAAVANQFNLHFPNCPLLTPNDKFLLSRIALGQSSPSVEFFLPMSRNLADDVAEEIVQSDPANITNTDNKSDSLIAPVPIQKDNSMLINNFETSMINMIQIVKDNKENESLMKAISNITNKIKNINSPENVTEFLHSMSLGYRIKFGKRIGVQPTAIARRKTGARKGSKRIAAGRPLNEVSAKKKRKRCLASNIEANVPNAKSHGRGH